MYVDPICVQPAENQPQRQVQGRVREAVQTNGGIMAVIKNIQEKYMKEALKQARKAYALGEVPIGCVIVHQGKIIGRGYNRRNTDKNTLSHAEIAAIRRASKVIGDWRLEECTHWNPVRCVPELLSRHVSPKLSSAV